MIELDWIKKWAQYSPTSLALTDGHTGRQWNYRELYDVSRAIGEQLVQRHGVSRGMRVALLASNELESVALFFAVARLGALLVPINHRLSPREVQYIINDCQPKVIFYEGEFIEKLSGTSYPVENFSKIHQSQLALSSVDLWQEEPMRSVDFKDGVLILYTSGTTGFPKGAVLTHQGLFWNSVNTTLRLNLSQNDCTVNFAPLFHTGGWNVLLTPFLHRGAHTILIKKFDGELILSLIEKYHCTLFFGVPTTLDMMAQSSRFDAADLSTVRYAIVGGEPMPVPLIQVWHAKGIPIRQGYGLTEFGPNVFSLNEEHALSKIGSIGFPNFYIQTRVVDRNGKDVSPEVIGELLLSGPMMMDRYWNNEKATAETIQQDWLATGDLVRKDSEGFFYVVGRKKEMYISGGENVYPAEVEQVLRSHPGIAEAAVVGVKDSKWGEVGCAFVVPKKSTKMSDAELSQFCLEHLAKFKTPKYFYIQQQLPKGDSGKILKKELLASVEKNFL